MILIHPSGFATSLNTDFCSNRAQKLVEFENLSFDKSSPLEFFNAALMEARQDVLLPTDVGFPITILASATLHVGYVHLR
jgi:hypothetical protein